MTPIVLRRCRSCDRGSQVWQQERRQAEGHDAALNRGVSLWMKTMDAGEDYGERNTSRNR
jgi:hypothetical protein